MNAARVADNMNLHKVFIGAKFSSVQNFFLCKFSAVRHSARYLHLCLSYHYFGTGRLNWSCSQPPAEAGSSLPVDENPAAESVCRVFVAADDILVLVRELADGNLRRAAHRVVAHPVYVHRVEPAVAAAHAALPSSAASHGKMPQISSR